VRRRVFGPASFLRLHSLFGNANRQASKRWVLATNFCWPKSIRRSICAFWPASCQGWAGGSRQVHSCRSTDTHVDLLTLRYELREPHMPIPHTITAELSEMRVAKGVKCRQTLPSCTLLRAPGAAVPLETSREAWRTTTPKPTQRSACGIRFTRPVLASQRLVRSNALASLFRAPHSTRGITRSDPHFTSWPVGAACERLVGSRLAWTHLPFVLRPGRRDARASSLAIPSPRRPRVQALPPASAACPFRNWNLSAEGRGRLRTYIT
jgi:hypothetical protein